jgi:predicted RNA-binding Zn-ribbon protein involved in translation (DUF1610 family)
MPLYEDLVRRAVAAGARSASLHRDSRLIQGLAQTLREAHQGEVVIRRCSWCGRLDVRGEWLHLEAIGDGQHRIATSLMERATNGICPDCLQIQLERAHAARSDGSR